MYLLSRIIDLSEFKPKLQNMKFKKPYSVVVAVTHCKETWLYEYCNAWRSNVPDLARIVVMTNIDVKLHCAKHILLFSYSRFDALVCLLQ